MSAQQQQPMPGSRRSRERALREELRVGIGRGEVVPYYHPILALRDRAVLRLEALARWQHPERGLVQPSEFIAVAERSGLMPELTAAVLEQAIEDLRPWREQLPRLRVAVNLSAHGLRDANVGEELAHRLTSLGASPDWLAVEITEGVLVSDASAARARIERLKQLGIRVEIDDFGTGYSSLRYLQLLPVDGVKIDRQFVSAVFTDRQSEVIVRTVIGMCHELGFEAVAEGVDAPEVWGLLKALGCDAGQGFLVAPPLAAAEMGRWLAVAARDRALFATSPVERTENGRVRPRPSHVLVVDDEPAILSLVQQVLAENGYRVKTAANGQEALEAMAQQRPAVVFLDMHMPVLNGEGFVHAMRERGLNVPVIILTAGPSADHWARELGVQGAVHKPFRIPDLINAATRFLIPADTVV
ncbi:MAG: EAL domain-containing protein [Chloroflexi bacterium]|nr:EAL domain-containing protein [Chloroflexota bacterium]